MLYGDSSNACGARNVNGTRTTHTARTYKSDSVFFGEFHPFPVIPFVVIACLLLLVALAFVLVPLWRARANADGVDSPRLPYAISSNVAVFRSQKREIEEEFLRGAIDVEERDVALGELSQRLVDELPADPATEGKPADPGRCSRPWLLSGTLVALIPVAAFMTYATFGSPQAMRAVGTRGITEMAQHAGVAAGPDADRQILAMDQFWRGIPAALGR